MKFIRIAALLLLCLCLLPGCANDDADNPEMPETHVGAIDPNAITAAHIVHYTKTGEIDFETDLVYGDIFLPLMATVYDIAAETNLIGERVKIYDLTMTGEGIEINLTVYSDMTMEDGSRVLTGKDMHDFLNSFLIVPNETAAGA